MQVGLPADLRGGLTDDQHFLRGRNVVAGRPGGDSGEIELGGEIGCRCAEHEAVSPQFDGSFQRC